MQYIASRYLAVSFWEIEPLISF